MPCHARQKKTNEDTETRCVLKIASQDITASNYWVVRILRQKV